MAGIGSGVTVNDGYMANARFGGACGGPGGIGACPHGPGGVYTLDCARGRGGGGLERCGTGPAGGGGFE